jgi:hypothetical protein
MIGRVLPNTQRSLLVDPQHRADVSGLEYLADLSAEM